MTSSWIRTSARAGLGLAATLALTLSFAGCNSKAPDTGEAVVVPEPNANVPTVGTTANAPAGGTSTAATPSATSPIPTVMTKAEGWGTLKGQITLKGNPPKPKELAPKGNAAK